MAMLRAGGLLDVLTPWSDCREESVEKMERRISGVSYIYWMDLCCGFLCAWLISVSLFRRPRRGLPRPNVSLFRLPRRGLPRPNALFSGYHAEGYHARTDTFKITGYRVCKVTTPELSRSKQTSGYRRVITPAGSSSYFSFHRLIRQYIHNHNTTFPPSLAHTARTHSTPLALPAING